jgi:hypothetical protein
MEKKCPTCKHNSAVLCPGIENGPGGCILARCSSDGYRYWEPKEVSMDFKAACEAINKVDDSIICSKGKDAVKGIIAALCGEKVEKTLFRSAYDNMVVDSWGYYNVNGAVSGSICLIEDGMLAICDSVNKELGLRLDSEKSIIIKAPCTVMGSDGKLVEVK